MTTMHKIAVMGGRETVMGFKALGLEVYPVADIKEAHEVFHDLSSDEEYAIIYVEENLAEGLASDIAKFKDSPSPAVILIPGREGSLGLGRRALQDAVERAVGSDIM